MGVLLFLLVSAAAAVAATSTNAAPVQPQPTSASEEDFGQFLAVHQDDLAPFFAKHTDDIVKEGIPIFLAVFINFILLNIVVGWAFDVGISYGFSSLYAPAYAKLKQALIYATGRQVVTLLVGLLTGLVAFGVGLLHSFPLLIVAGILMVLIDIAVQTVWAVAIYRTRIIVAVLFCLCLQGVHVAAEALGSGPIMRAKLKHAMAQFVDQHITAQLVADTAEIKRDQAAAEAARDKVQAQITEAQNRIDEANSDIDKLTKDIEAKKSSDVFVFGRIVRIHAQGDLATAHDQFTDFLAKFHSGPLVEAAKEQLAMVDSEIAVQDAAQKQAAADAAAAVAAARANLLAHATQGTATLTEIRDAIIGKPREEVKALFGTPSDVASDRWGYSQITILNPLTNERHGLAVYFAEGTVQSVDYYYGISR